MKRSSSMERAVPILLDPPLESGNSSRFSSAEDEEEDQPPPLPRTPEPNSCSRSTSSWLSPVSAISYDFRFLDESPGIRLVSSSSDLEQSSGPEGEWSELRMAKVDVRSETLSSVGNINRPYFTNPGSLESLDGGPSSSICDEITTGTSGSGMLHSHASQPSLYYHHLSDSENQLYEMNRLSKRAKSFESITNTPKVELQDSYHSLDRGRRGSNVSNNNNTEKVTYAVLPNESYVNSDSEEIPAPDDSKYFLEDVQELINTSDCSIPDSPSWHEERPLDLDKSRILELPSISEENEDHNRSRRSSMNVGQQRSSVDFGLPEPAEIAPGSFSPAMGAGKEWTNSPSVSGEAENHQVIHRRVVSDNHVYYGKRSDEELFSPRSEISEPAPNEILLRNAPGRASQTGRCQSQVVLNHVESDPGAINDRSLSNSDPELNKEKGPSGPPPVFLTRRNSSIKSHGDSWKSVFGYGNATPHHVVTPATASLSASSSSRSSSRTNVACDSASNGEESPPCLGLKRTPSSSSVVAFVRRSIRRISGGSRRDSLPPSPELLDSIAQELNENGTLRRRATTPYRKRSRLKMMRDRSRVEKKTKEKSGSETLTSTISNIFGYKKKGKERASIDNVLNGYNRAVPSTSSTMPAKRSTESRPGIPSFSEGLPDNISAVFSPSAFDESEHGFDKPVDVMSILLDNPKYARLELFTEPSYQSWHEKFRHDKLSRKAVKKQDAIYELINLERQHCANLAFLQDAYRRPLLERNILSRNDLDVLIPDVIDSLLLFHCNLLEHLLSRQVEKNEVDTICDILLKELSEDGKYTAVVTDAYTNFGSSKEKSEVMLNNLMARNPRFADFMKRCSRDKVYRQYDFKSIMARIMARPTKYGLLIETILRNEANQFTPAAELSEKALGASKRFAARIDNNLLIVQLTKRWDQVRAQFDTSSTTFVYITDKSIPDGSLKLDWTLDDICSQMGGEEGRRLICIGEASVKVSGKANAASGRAHSVLLVCFDDILVCLARKSNGKYIFAPMDQPVIAIANLVHRKLAGQGHKLVLLIPGLSPMLMEIEFPNRTGFEKWDRTLEKAIRAAPAKVRLRPQSADECLRQATIAHEREEKKQKEAEEQWMRRLITLFQTRSEQESALVNEYMSKGMDFVDEVQHFLGEMPLRGRLELQERVKETLKAKFKEMRNSKNVPLRKLIEDMTKAKESVLWNYLNELEEGGREGDSDGSGSDSSGSGRSRPRRIKTFHGATGQSTSKHQKSSLRRHTTVPRMKDEMDIGEESDDSKREREDAEEKAHEMPLTQSLSCHRVCRTLCRDVVKLKNENISLKNEKALDKLRIISLEKMRSSSTTVLSSSVETLEALRRKEMDVREDEKRRKQRLEQFEKELQERQNKLEEDRALWEQQKQKDMLDHQRREAELEEKWAVLRQAERTGDFSPSRIRSQQRISMNDYVAKSPTYSPTIQTMTPELKNLTVKTEIRKKK